MAPFRRKVKTASEATAVQIVEKRDGLRTVLKHLGSAHSEAELAALMRDRHEQLHPGQGTLDLGIEKTIDPSQAVVTGYRSQLLIDVIRGAYTRRGFDVLNDEAFFPLVLARMIEPTSKAHSVRVVEELDVVSRHRLTRESARVLCRYVAGAGSRVRAS